jgi:hypothetical protein
MTGLAEDQARFIAVLQQGPEAFPHGLFADSPERALLGLRAHANTISHARLVALEETFPRTLERMGHATFNARSREFAELPHVRVRKLMQLGQGFGDFLAVRGEDAECADLAAIEWAWLEAYHSAEAATLRLTDLAGLDEAALLALPIAIHPAARIVGLASAAHVLLPELAAAPPKARHVLITRLDADVYLRALASLEAVLAEAVENAGVLGNLLALAIEQGGEADALPAIFALIDAGMLTSPGG